VRLKAPSANKIEGVNTAGRIAGHDAVGAGEGAALGVTFTGEGHAGSIARDLT
jgi:hypothetical protein